MRVQDFSCGSICIDSVTYEHDVIIESGKVRKRKKRASKQFRNGFGHTPLSLEEEIPWECRRLIKHARHYWLRLAESHLTRRLVGNMARRIDVLPAPAGRPKLERRQTRGTAGPGTEIPATITWVSAIDRTR